MRVGKRILIPVILGLVLVIAVTGAVLAQTATPGGQGSGSSAEATAQPRLGFPFFWGGLRDGFGQNNWSGFDAIATALKLTPAQLFEQMHSGKTLAQIAQAQGVDLTAVQSAAQASQTDALKAAIAQAVKNGDMTQAEADWLQQGISNGWVPGGKGMGGMGERGGTMRGLGHAPVGARSDQRQAKPTATPKP